MKRAVKILPKIFTAILSACSFVFIFFFVGHFLSLARQPSIQKLELDGRMYANKVIPSILSSWDTRALISQASEMFMQKASLKDIHNNFDYFQKFFGSYNGCEGAKGSIKDYSSEEVLAEYFENCKFEKDEAHVDMMIVRTGGSWKDSGIFVKG